MIDNCPTKMLMLCIILAVVLFLIMRYLLKQSYPVAITRSALIATVVMLYLVLFGYSLPTKFNKNLFSKSK